MIENFKIRNELFGDTQHEAVHFALTFEGKEYQGHYKDGDVNWLHMRPNQDHHEMDLERLDEEVKKLLQ
jgi:hypothetical protein